MRIAALVLLWPAVAVAGEPTATATDGRGPDATVTDVGDVGSAAAFVAGVLTGLAGHELGHMLSDLAYGNRPALRGELEFGFIPFVFVDPRINCSADPCVGWDGKPFRGGRRGKFAVQTIGFNVQNLGSEVVLTHASDLRRRRAPFRKGLLAFNALTSLAYAASAIARVEPEHGDVHNNARLRHVNRDLFAAMVLLPAALDLYRYFRPGSRWAPSVSRGSKAAFLGLVLTF